jgi:4-hydroxybenzoate polyprenyltransferase
VSVAVRTALRLGRVSNLPTVWTNVLASIALAGGEALAALVLPLGLGVSLLYVSGMYLNDAFDRGWDSVHRPERPIPSGAVSARVVFGAGFALMGAGLAVLAAAAGPRPLLAGAVLAALIVAYDVVHKRSPLAVVLMGLCRVAVYVTAAMAVTARPRPALALGGVLLLAYMVSLTAIARHEARNPRLPALVGALLAGICLFDAGVLLALERPLQAGLAALGFPLTLALQRHVPGT